MITPKKHVAVALYDVPEYAADAVWTLQCAGFNMQRVSVAGEHDLTEERPLGMLNGIDRATLFGKLSGSWRSLAGLLFGSSAVFVPKAGHVLILGSVAAQKLRDAPADSAAIHPGPLAWSLAALGIPASSTVRHNIALDAGNFMLIVHGDEIDINRARELLENSGFGSFDHYRL